MVVDGLTSYRTGVADCSPRVVVGTMISMLICQL
jgi:hypothetical protein